MTLPMCMIWPLQDIGAARHYSLPSDVDDDLKRAGVFIILIISRVITEHTELTKQKSLRIAVPLENGVYKTYTYIMFGKNTAVQCSPSISDREL